MPELKSLASDEQEAAGPTYLRSEFLLHARNGVEGMAGAGLRGLASRFWPPCLPEAEAGWEIEGTHMSCYFA